MKNALIVVDMVKDFVEEDGALYIGDHVNTIISPINCLIKESLGKQDMVYFICTSYPKDHFKDNYGEKIPHCVVDTIGREVTDKFDSIPLRYLQNVLYIPKIHISGFRDNAFQHFINTIGVFESYNICGIYTSTSILLTATDMMNQGLKNVSVVMNAICDVLDEDHKAGIKVMQNSGIGFGHWIPDNDE